MGAVELRYTWPSVCCPHQCVQSSRWSVCVCWAVTRWPGEQQQWALQQVRQPVTSCVFTATLLASDKSAAPNPADTRAAKPKTSQIKFFNVHTGAAAGGWRWGGPTVQPRGPIRAHGIRTFTVEVLILWSLEYRFLSLRGAPERTMKCPTQQRTWMKPKRS